MKARARQEKLLAKMSSSQRAFMLNPVNKTDIDAFTEQQQQQQQQHTTTSPSSQTVVAASTLSSSSSSSTDTPTTAPTPAVATKTKSDASLNGATPPPPSTSANASAHQVRVECCICGASSGDRDSRPIGLVALIQATSVLGHRLAPHASSESSKSSPASASEKCWHIEEKRVELLRAATATASASASSSQRYSNESCKYAVNIGWRGGLYTQICGHYLHFDCYSSYKRTLDEQQQQLQQQPLQQQFPEATQALRNARIEFACPLCRQLANCVLPVVAAGAPTLLGGEETEKTATSTIATTTTANLTDQHVLDLLNYKLLSQVQVSTPSPHKHAHKLSHLVIYIRRDNIKSSSINPWLNIKMSNSANSFCCCLIDIFDYSLTNFVQKKQTKTIQSNRTLTRYKQDALDTFIVTTPSEYRHVFGRGDKAPISSSSSAAAALASSSSSSSSLSSSASSASSSLAASLHVGAHLINSLNQRAEGNYTTPPAGTAAAAAAIFYHLPSYPLIFAGHNNNNNNNNNNNSSMSSNHNVAEQWVDINVFITSILRTQLEIDLMLLAAAPAASSSTTRATRLATHRKKRACFGMFRPPPPPTPSTTTTTITTASKINDN